MHRTERNSRRVVHFVNDIGAPSSRRLTLWRGTFLEFSASSAPLRDTFSFTV